MLKVPQTSNQPTEHCADETHAGTTSVPRKSVVGPKQQHFKGHTKSF